MLARRSIHRTLIVLLAVVLCLSIVGEADAQSEQRSRYDGLQLAPTAHASAAVPHYRAGVGVDLSVNRWLDLEIWGSRVSRPTVDRWYPGAWSTGLAVHSRVAWRTHAFVYGGGLVYTSTFQCPVGCTIWSSIALEEHRAAIGLYAAQARLGYEVRLESGWYGRALTTFDLPFASRRVVHFTRDDRYDYHEPPPTFMHGSLVLTLGYAFRLGES